MMDQTGSEIDVPFQSMGVHIRTPLSNTQWSTFRHGYLENFMNDGENVRMSTQRHEKGNHMGGSVRPIVYMPRLLDSVPFSLQQKIWTGKYIDMKDLLQLNSQASTEASKLSIKIPEDGMPMLIQVPARKKSLSYNKYYAGWRLYKAVYLVKFQHEVQPMLAYQNDISVFASQSLDWASYDKVFRRGRETNRYPWDAIQPDLDRKLYACRQDNSMARGLSKKSASSRGNNHDRLNLQSVGEDGNVQSSASQRFFREGGHLFRSSQASRQYSFSGNERNSLSFRTIGSQAKIQNIIECHITQTANQEITGFETFFVPMGSCYRYHRNGKCFESCRYDHQCFQCGGWHRACFCSAGEHLFKSNKQSGEPKESTANNSKI